MKVFFISSLVSILVFSCATSNPNSNYKEKIYTKERKALLIGGVIANVNVKDPDRGTISDDFSRGFGAIGSLFRSKESQEKLLKEKEGVEMKGEAGLLFVKPENKVKPKEYADIVIGGFNSNDMDKPAMQMVTPGKYILKSYKFHGSSIVKGESGYSTMEVLKMKYFDTDNVELTLAEGDVVYVGNFEINEKNEQHTLKTMDQSKQIKEFLSKKYPNLADRLKVNVIKVERIKDKLEEK